MDPRTKSANKINKATMKLFKNKKTIKIQHKAKKIIRNQQKDLSKHLNKFKDQIKKKQLNKNKK